MAIHFLVFSNLDLGVPLSNSKLSQFINMTEPYKLTASEALAHMRDGSLTVEFYAKSLLARIKARDDVVKAWAYLDPEFVLAQAKKLDEIPAEKRGPLHGIAIGVKDVILTKGLNEHPFLLEKCVDHVRQICQHNTTLQFTKTPQHP